MNGLTFGSTVLKLLAAMNEEKQADGNAAIASSRHHDLACPFRTHQAAHESGVRRIQRSLATSCPKCAGDDQDQLPPPAAIMALPRCRPSRPSARPFHRGWSCRNRRRRRLPWRRSRPRTSGHARSRPGNPDRGSAAAATSELRQLLPVEAHRRRQSSWPAEPQGSASGIRRQICRDSSQRTGYP